MYWRSSSLSTSIIIAVGEAADDDEGLPCLFLSLTSTSMTGDARSSGMSMLSMSSMSSMEYSFFPSVLFTTCRS